MKKNITFFLLFAIISTFAFSQEIFKSLKGYKYGLNSELQSKFSPSDFKNLKFSLNETLVFNGETPSGMNTTPGKKYYYIEFTKKEIAFKVDESLWKSDYSYGKTDISSEWYLCTSDDNAKTLILTKKGYPNFKKVFKITEMHPFTLVVLE